MVFVFSFWIWRDMYLEFLGDGELKWVLRLLAPEERFEIAKKLLQFPDRFKFSRSPRNPMHIFLNKTIAFITHIIVYYRLFLKIRYVSALCIVFAIFMVNVFQHVSIDLPLHAQNSGFWTNLLFLTVVWNKGLRRQKTASYFLVCVKKDFDLASDILMLLFHCTPIPKGIQSFLFG